MSDRNGPLPTRLAQVLHALRIRITSEPGIVPRQFEVNGLAMTEKEFRDFCWCLGVDPGAVVEAVRGKGKGKR